MSSIFDTLKERGFVKQATNEEEVRTVLDDGKLTFYIGFDPTGDCLHVGHLLPVMCMAWLQRAGHLPIIVLGGGTAMVGDPSGKDKTRDILTTEKIQSNLDAMKPLFARFIDFENAKIVNNADWLLPLNYVEFLRDIGRHFSINVMIKAEGAKQRLERNQGYSFIEFNYHLLQSYDFLHLYKEHNCKLQVGGDDQWFHFTGGLELIRKETGGKGFAFTIPLLTTSDGKKMGKTEKGAVWIDQNRLSSYDYYQYWVNVQDADAIKFMKLYTFMDMAEIEKYAQLQGAQIRDAKHRLAFEATKLAHGEEAAKQAQKAALAAFSGAISDDMPMHSASLPTGVVELLVDAGLCSTKSEARRSIKGGAIKMDYGQGKKAIQNKEQVISEAGILWFGKKKCVRILGE